MNPLKNKNATHYHNPKPLDEVIEKLKDTEIFADWELYEAERMSKKHETIDLVMALLTKEEMIGWAKGNIIKYLSRNKGQDDLDDEKVQDYIRFARWVKCW